MASLHESMAAVLAVKEPGRVEMVLARYLDFHSLYNASMHLVQVYLFSSFSSSSPSPSFTYTKHH
jgi:hypothetical protein